ncbi:MAG: hypothetical protein WC595_03115 [Candidatus Nanoarchaeia archaeon]
MTTVGKLSPKDYDILMEICGKHGFEEGATEIDSVIIKQPYEPAQILSPDLKARIDRDWQTKLESARKGGTKPPHNGQLVEYRSHEVRVEEGVGRVLELRVGFTDYMTQTGVRVYSDGPQIWSLGQGSIAFFQGEDGERSFLFGTRSKHVAQLLGSKESIPSGYVDTETVEHYGSEALDRNLRREFTEETLGLPEERIVAMRPLGFTLIGTYINPKTEERRPLNDTQVHYALEFRATPNEIEEGRKRGKKLSGEHSEIMIVQESRLADFFTENGDQINRRTKASMKNFLTRYANAPLI